jgi:PRD domain protein (TIGR03582 family)
MRVDKETIGQVTAQLQADESEQRLVAGWLETILESAGAAGLTFTPEQHLGLGTHMLAALRRGESGEALPEVEADTLEQVSSKALTLSRDILDPIAAERNYAWNSTEALLLAVHFEAAMEE